MSVSAVNYTHQRSLFIQRKNRWWQNNIIEYGFSAGQRVIRTTARRVSMRVYTTMTKFVTSKSQHLFVVIIRLLVSIKRTHNATVECREILQ